MDSKNLEKYKEEVARYCATLPPISIFYKAANIAYEILNNLYNTYDEAIVDETLSVMNALFTGWLTPITFDDSDFIDETIDNEIRTINKRAPFITKEYISNYSGIDIIKYRNNEAWYPNVIKVYDNISKCEITNEVLEGRQIPTPCKEELYLSAGGVVNGHYIKECFIKDTKNYYPAEPIKIPVYIIVDNNVSYYITDYRDTKIKVLKSIYETFTYENKFVKGKYDIRKYKKFNK